MKIAISAESTIDLPKEMLKENNISTIAFPLLLGEDEYLDNEIKPTEIFDFVNKTKVLPKTSAINQHQYYEYFSGLLKEYDAVVHIALSSGISSTCRNAQLAAAELKNVFVIDSKTLSTGIALLALYAKKLCDSGETAEVIYEKTQKQAENVCASFIIDRLDYLYKGGRCSALTLLGANVLKLHPQIIMKDGTMQVAKKYMGKLEKIISGFGEDLLKAYDNPNLETAFITYTTASEEMLENAKSVLKNAGFKNIYSTLAGATISCHCGENTLGFFYLRQ